jgi:hypothetical protein
MGMRDAMVAAMGKAQKSHLEKPVVLVVKSLEDVLATGGEATFERTNITVQTDDMKRNSEYVRKSRWYVRSAAGHVVYVHCRDRKKAQAVIAKLFGVDSSGMSKYKVQSEGLV